MSIPAEIFLRKCFIERIRIMKIIVLVKLGIRNFVNETLQFLLQEIPPFLTKEMLERANR